MRPKSRFRSHQHPTEKHLKGKTDPEPEFAQVEWLSVIRERQVRLKVKSVKYGVVKKPKTEKPSETKPAYLMQSHHNNSTSLLHCHLCVGVVFHVIIQVFQLRAEGSFSSDPALH